MNLSDIPAWCIVSANGTKGADEAFGKLESCLPTMRGRKFYGVYDVQKNIYRACVMKLSGEQLSIEDWTIPGGEYVRTIISHWNHDPSVIASIFHEVAKKYTVDPTRPSIEYYRRFDEPHLFLPVLV
jgi:hypothetical protein